MTTAAEDIHSICVRSVGKRVWYNGTNGDEYDELNHGKPVVGMGFCLRYHDSHGLCIIVKHEDGSEICVDPVQVEVLD